MLLITAITLISKPFPQIHELLPEPEQETEDCEGLEVDTRESNSPLLPNQLSGTHIRATRDSQGNMSWLL